MRRSITTALAALLVLGLGLTAPSTANADEGTLSRGYPQSSWPTVADEARISQLGAYSVQEMLRELYRSADGTATDGCLSTGFQCVAGSGFNVNVSAGTCLYTNATGADADTSSYRAIHLGAAEAATDWDANPGAATYYVHVTYGDATVDGVVTSDPTYTVDTNATLAGAYTPCSITVAGAEPSAATYTITDLRYVLGGPEHAPHGADLGDGRLRVAKVVVDTEGERTAGAHAIVTLPAGAIVEEVLAVVTTQETSGTTTVDIGPAGTADGYANDLSVAATGFVRPGVTVTTGGTEVYLSASTRGSLLASFNAGADVAGDVGHYIEVPDGVSGTKVVSYTVPGGGWTEFVGTFYVRFYVAE